MAILLTPIIRKHLNIPTSVGIFNDKTSTNRRRLKITKCIGTIDDNLILLINMDLKEAGWYIRDHGPYQSGTWFGKAIGCCYNIYLERIQFQGVTSDKPKKLLNHKIDKFSQMEETIPVKALARMVDFNFLSEHGIIHLINNELLHPIGLALTRESVGDNPRISKGCLIAPDLKWEYPDEVHQRNHDKFQNFMMNREAILNSILQGKINDNN